MISDSDSGSDSDDCLVYKTVRPVVWSDEEEEKPKDDAGAGSRRAREEGVGDIVGDGVPGVGW